MDVDQLSDDSLDEDFSDASGSLDQNDDDLMEEEWADEAELQSLLQSALEKTPKKGINDVSALERKLEEIALKIPGLKNPVPWSETLVLTSNFSLVERLKDNDDDLSREKLFYEQTLNNVKSGLQRLKREGIPYQRPDDYFAEMIKTDEHMLKVKNSLLKEKRMIEEATERRKTREQKKFAKKVEAETKQLRKKQKDADLDAIKKWRKEQKGSNAEFPEELLDPNSKLRKNMDKKKGSPFAKNDPRKKVTKADIKAKKYAPKRRDKKNDSSSSGDFIGFKSTKEFGGRGGRGRGAGGRGGPGGRGGASSGRGGASGGRPGGRSQGDFSAKRKRSDGGNRGRPQKRQRK